MAQLGCCSSSGSANDAVCTTVSVVDDETPISIWTNTTNFIMNGTVLVENQGVIDAWTVDIFINGSATPATPALTILPGESKSISVNNLMSIEVQGETGGTTATPVKVSFSLNYSF